MDGSAFISAEWGVSGGICTVIDLNTQIYKQHVAKFHTRSRMQHFKNVNCNLWGFLSSTLKHRLAKIRGLQKSHSITAILKFY